LFNINILRYEIIAAKATGGLVQHRIAKKAGLKKFFEGSVKVAAKKFSLFQRKL